MNKGFQECEVSLHRTSEIKYLKMFECLCMVCACLYTCVYSCAHVCTHPLLHLCPFPPYLVVNLLNLFMRRDLSLEPELTVLSGCNMESTCLDCGTFRCWDHRCLLPYLTFMWVQSPEHRTYDCAVSF